MIRNLAYLTRQIVQKTQKVCDSPTVNNRG